MNGNLQTVKIDASLLPVEYYRRKQPDGLVLDHPVCGQDNPANRYLSTHQGATHRTYMSRIQRLVKLIVPNCPSYEHFNWAALDTTRIISELNRIAFQSDRRISNATLNGYLSILKNVYKYAARMGIVDSQQMIEIKEINCLPIQHGLSGKMATTDQKKALIQASRNDNPREKAARNTAIITLLFYAGLRRSEVASLKMEHVSLLDGTAKIFGKGRTEFTIHLDERILEALQAWITFRGHASGSLFYRLKRNGKPYEKAGITDATIRLIMAHYSEVIGLKGCQKLTPHDARRTFGSELLDITDIKTAADLMRHSNINQTAKYDRRIGERKKKALSLLT